MAATVSGDAATKGFLPGNKSWPLALRLSGKFKTAFPEGRPKSGDRKAAAAKEEAVLKESAADNAVVLVADTDMLNDGAAVDVQEVFGRRVVVPSNGNLAFAQSLVEQFGRGRRADLAAQPRRRLPAADRGARNAGQGPGAVPRAPEGARRRAAEDDGKAAGTAEVGRRRGQGRLDHDPRAAGGDRKIQGPGHRDAQGTEGTAQEAAPGRRGARVLDQAARTSR